MKDLLHDRIDEMEIFRDKARDIAEAVVKEKLAAAMQATNNNIGQALEILAADVGDSLASLTTEAAQAGHDYAIRRGEKARGV